MIFRGSAIVRSAVAALMLGGSTVAAHAAEPLDLVQTYSGYSDYDVAHIETVNTYGDNSLGTSNSDSLSAGFFSFSDPFIKSSANPPITTFFMGVSNEGTETDHLVLGVASAYAAGLVSGGEDFSQIYPNYSEASLISDLELIDGNNSQPGDPDYQAVQDARNELVNFSFGISDNLGFAPAFNGPMTLLSFSSANPIGYATASLVNNGSAAPEPATWGLLVAGFGMIGGTMRRRAKAKLAFA